MSEPRNAGPGPVIWLVIGIPLLTVIGGFWTLALATRAGESDAVADDVQRTAQVQDRDLGTDLAATRRGLRLDLAVAADGRSLVLVQSGGEALPRTPLFLQFIHPLHADADRRLPMQPTAQGWQAALPPLADGDWHLELRDDRDQWRVVGRWPRAATRATLAPALPP